MHLRVSSSDGHPQAVGADFPLDRPFTRAQARDCGPDSRTLALLVGPHGSYFLDLGVPEVRYAEAYDGVEWHGPERRAHDAARRAWVRKYDGYVIDVFVSEGIHGHHQDAPRLLRAGMSDARRRLGVAG